MKIWWKKLTWQEVKTNMTGSKIDIIVSTFSLFLIFILTNNTNYILPGYSWHDVPTHDRYKMLISRYYFFLDRRHNVIRSRQHWCYSLQTAWTIIIIIINNLQTTLIMYNKGLWYPFPFQLTFDIFVRQEFLWFDRMVHTLHQL